MSEPGRPTRYPATALIELLESLRTDDNPRPTYEQCVAGGYPGAFSTWRKTANPWARTQGIELKPGSPGTRTTAFRGSLKALEGVEDYEERKRLVREATLEEMSPNYCGRPRRVGLSRARKTQ